MRFIVPLAQWIYPIRKRINAFLNAGTNLSPKIKMTGSKSIYDYTPEGIDGKPLPLAQFKGKKMLIVNTASECGFTPQYEGLQALWEKYKDHLVVIGFPSNDFDAQEPGDESAILSFCQKNYGVTFPLTKKIKVTGDTQHDVFRWLTKKELNGWNDRDPNWNFCKYLVDENGNLKSFFSHKTDPLNPKIISEIEQTSLF